MAEYLLRNSLSPGKVVSCLITFRQLVNKGEDGEPVWLVEISTVEPHKDGGNIRPEYVHYNNSQNLDDAIKEATENIAAQIEWLPFTEDTRPPFVDYYNPRTATADIYSDVVVDIKDVLPSAGIDLNSIEVVVNEIDVTNEISVDGDPYGYRVIWSPEIRVFDQV